MSSSPLLPISLLLTLALLLPQAAHGQQCLTSNDYRDPNPNGQRSLYQGQQEFSLALLNAINQLNPDGNIFFSPYSTYHALLLAYFISGNRTEGFLRKTLRLDAKQDKADIFAAYKLDRLQQTLGNKSYEFTNANRIYVTDQVQVRGCINDRFGEELQSKINFRDDAEFIRDGINKWVETATHDMIKDLLPPGAIDQETSLVLVNAAYFKGIWENKFDPELTKPNVFYINPQKQTVVDFMHVEGTFNHDVSDVLKAHILELPYKGEDISMYILLPPYLKDDISNTLKALTAERFRSIIDEERTTLTPKTVKVTLPKFTLEHTIEMVPVLEKLGAGDLFSKQADFSTLTDQLNGVSLGNALHKAKIELNEAGTKAAASTVLFSFRSSRDSEPESFVCNHPFVYVIYDKITKAMLFTGVFRRPH